MSRITIGNKASISMLQELARQAYGHGSTSAGWGRIGMVGNHVVKFNTVVREDLKDYATQVMNDKLGVGKADVSDLAFDSKKSGLLQYGATWTIKLGDKEFKRDPGEDPEKWKARLEDGIREFFGDDKLGILADRMFKDGLEVGMGGFLLNAGVPCRTPVRIFGMQTDENAVIVSFEKTDNGYRISESRTIENPSAVRFLPPGADELVQCSLKTDPDTMKKANPPEGSHVTTDYEVEIVRNGWSGDSKGRLPKIVVPKDPTVTFNLGEEPERHYQKSVD